MCACVYEQRVTFASRFQSACLAYIQQHPMMKQHFAGDRETPDAVTEDVNTPPPKISVAVNRGRSIRFPRDVRFKSTVDSQNGFDCSANHLYRLLPAILPPSPSRGGGGGGGVDGGLSLRSPGSRRSFDLTRNLNKPVCLIHSFFFFF